MALADRISGISNVISSGTSIIDASMVNRLANVAAEISSVQAKLTTAGLTDLATSLAGFDHASVSSLGTYIANAQTTLLSTMSEFSSIKSFSPGASVSDAFGPMLRARGMVTALDSLDSVLDGESFDADALADITARVTQISELPAQVTTLISNAEGFFEQGRNTAANAVQATQIVSMFDDLDLKMVLGSLVSDAFLAVLKSDDD